MLYFYFVLLSCPCLPRKSKKVFSQATGRNSRTNSVLRYGNIKLASRCTLRISSALHCTYCAIAPVHVQSTTGAMHGQQFCFTSILQVHPRTQTRNPQLQLRGMQKYPFQKATGNQFACSKTHTTTQHSSTAPTAAQQDT